MVDHCHAQHSTSGIEFSKIKQRKIRKMVRQQCDSAGGLSDLEISVGTGSDLNGFYHYEKEYQVKEDINEVWFNYLKANQTEIWDISRISFGLIYCRDSDSFIYADQFLFGLEKRQIYFLNLKILNGLYHLPVAFEITNIDPEKLMIEFSYLRGGKALGKQVIQFAETDEGFTKINHQSFVKSESKLRDKYLYPYFHNKLINEFHFNMKRYITSKVKRRIDLVAEAH
jgi:hypothetical protein